MSSSLAGADQLYDATTPGVSGISCPIHPEPRRLPHSDTPHDVFLRGRKRPSKPPIGEIPERDSSSSHSGAWRVQLDFCREQILGSVNGFLAQIKIKDECVFPTLEDRSRRMITAKRHGKWRVFHKEARSNGRGACSPQR